MRDKEAITQNKAFLKSYVIARLLNQVSYEKLVQEYDREQLRFLREYTRLMYLEV